MERKELDFAMTVQDSFVLGLKNAPSIVAAFLLWIVTIWIPYINVGTTIAFMTLPVELAKGNVVNPLSIFDAKWRRYMGEFFMTWALMIIPIYIAMLFLLIPGIVLAISWTLSFYILIDKGKNPIQSIKASNDATYGSKWSIFFAQLLIWFMLMIVFGILFGICVLADSMLLKVVLTILFVIFAAAISMGTSASIWRQLRDNVE